MRPTANSIKWVFFVKQSEGESAKFSGARGLSALDLVFRHLPRDCVSVQAEQLRGIADSAIGPLERSRDEDFFEFPPGVLVANAPVQHHSDEALELIAHVRRY